MNESKIPDLLPRARRSLDEILAPLREQVRVSGLGDDELTCLFEDARNEAASGR